MGEAKRRGTLEQRKAKAVEREFKLGIERQAAEAQRIANMTPWERQRERELKILRGAAEAFALSAMRIK